MKYSDALITSLSYIRQPQKRKLIEIAYGLQSKVGLEIGGPSKFFNLKGGFPVYPFAKRMDGVNYSSETVWEGKLEPGNTYHYFKGKTGFQYITEATQLQGIGDHSYEFLLSCHSLEHIANPVKALFEWERVLKVGAMLILVLPDKRYTFDVKRPYTTLQHLLDDYQSDTNEQDTTHFEEILTYHDIANDEGSDTKTALEKRLYDNYSNRCAHHHVFSFEVIKEMLHYCGFETVYQQEIAPFHLVTIAHK